MQLITLEQMRIFHTISNKTWGGGEQTVLDLSRRQLADGIQVELFCLPKKSMVDMFRDLNVPIHQMPLRGVLDLKSAWQMAGVIRHGEITAIHAHNFKEAFTAAYARVLAGRKDIRLVMCRNLTRKGKNSLPYRWLYRQLDTIVFDSQLAMDEFLSTGPAIGREKLRVIFNAVVMPEKLVPADVRGKHGIPQDELVVMYHGRLDPEKGIDVLIEAVALLRDLPFRLVLVGRGSEEYTAHLQQLIADRQLTGKVVMAGFLSAVLPYVAAADIGVLPSIVPEGCSLSAQEHLSQGHPIIATNNGGQREYIVDGSNGLLVPPGDAQALAGALTRLIGNEALRRQMGRQARADYDDHLNYEHFYQQIQTIYQS
jgi:glycosyltransferase involved in cell wall biosynthesis